MKCQWIDDETREPCDGEAVVGVGHNAIWVCMTHYEEYLALAASVIHRLREEVTP